MQIVFTNPFMTEASGQYSISGSRAVTELYPPQHSILAIRTLKPKLISCKQKTTAASFDEYLVFCICYIKRLGSISRLRDATTMAEPGAGNKRPAPASGLSDFSHPPKRVRSVSPDSDSSADRSTPENPDGDQSVPANLPATSSGFKTFKFPVFGHVLPLPPAFCASTASTGQEPLKSTESPSVEISESSTTCGVITIALNGTVASCPLDLPNEDGASNDDSTSMPSTPRATETPVEAIARNLSQLSSPSLISFGSPGPRSIRDVHSGDKSPPQLSPFSKSTFKGPALVPIPGIAGIGPISPVSKPSLSAFTAISPLGRRATFGTPGFASSSSIKRAVEQNSVSVAVCSQNLLGESGFHRPKRINGLFTPDGSEESQPLLPEAPPSPAPVQHAAIHGIIDLVTQFQLDNDSLKSQVAKLLEENSILRIKNSEIQAQSNAIRQTNTEISMESASFRIQNEMVKVENDKLKVENFHLKDDVEYLENFRNIGIEARNRFLECMRRVQPRNPSIIEAGNRAVHGGIALTDAILYSEFVPNRRTDIETFERLYVFSPRFVLYYRQCPRLLDILDWRGSIVAMGRIAYEAVEFENFFDEVRRRLKTFDLTMGERGLQLMLDMFKERSIHQAVMEMKRCIDSCLRIRWVEREREREGSKRRTST